MDRTIKVSEDLSVIVSSEGIVIDRFEQGIRVSSKGRTYGEIEEEDPELFQLLMRQDATHGMVNSHALEISCG
jgi:hypothetical protein